MSAPASEIDRRVETVRRFNRLYTRKIGVLPDEHLDSPYSLSEARILYELAQGPARPAREVREALALDQGYMSRLLARLEKDGLLTRRALDGDARAQSLSLTAKGKRLFAELDRRARESIAHLLENFSEREQQDISAALETLTRLLGETRGEKPAVVLRPPRAGDLGWVIHRQAMLYAEEYGFDSSYETLAAEIVAKFAKTFDPACEQCWIAEIDGAPAGTVFLVKEDARVARLRLLHVEPFARGLGIGRMLVEACIATARACGYRTLRLWTNDVLVSARRIYEAAGFRLVVSENHHSFGKDLVGQTWELALGPSARQTR